MTEMDRKKMKRDFILIEKFCSQYDLRDEENAKKLYAFIKEKNFFGTNIGVAFTNRLGKIANDHSVDYSCIICKAQTTDNGVVCKQCMAKIANLDKQNQVKKPEQSKVESQKADVNKKIKDISDKTKVAVQSGINETVKVAEWAKDKITEQVEDEKTKEAVKNVKDKSISGIKKLKKKWNGLSKKAKIIVAIIAMVVIIIPFAGGGSGNSSSVKNAETAEKVVDKLYPEKDDWSISDGGTFDMTIGALDTPVGKTTAYYSDIVEKSNDAKAIQAYYSEKVTCWVFKVHKNGPNIVQQGTVMVSPYGQVFVQGVFEDLPSSDFNYRMR